MSFRTIHGTFTFWWVQRLFVGGGRGGAGHILCPLHSPRKLLSLGPSLLAPLRRCVWPTPSSQASLAPLSATPGPLPRSPPAASHPNLCFSASWSLVWERNRSREDGGLLFGPGHTVGPSGHSSLRDPRHLSFLPFFGPNRASASPWRPFQLLSSAPSLGPRPLATQQTVSISSLTSLLSTVTWAPLNFSLPGLPR